MENPKRKYHSRVALFADMDDYVDPMEIAIGLINIYQFFKLGCETLQQKLFENQEEAA